MTDIELATIITQAQHMVIAVVQPDGTPWAVPVHVRDHTANTFEWDSKLSTVHSQAIENNPTIAITLFSTQLNLGFYATATAEVVSKRDDGYARYRATIKEAWINESFRKRPVSLS